MTRPRLCSSVLLGSLAVLGLAACSFSFKAGGSSSAKAGKPAHAHDDHDHGSTPGSKPIGNADPAQDDPAPSDPAGDEPTAGDDPSRVPPTEEPPPVVEPRLTAVCRVGDETLTALCHRAFDPVAADDLDGWASQLAEGVVLTRPSHQEGMQRLQGAELVQALASRSGGLRSMLHLRPTDRVVVTLSNDCRACRRSLVAFEVNTRSGTVGVTFEMTKPPRIAVVEVAAQVRRRHLGQAGPKQPSTEPTPTVVVPPKEEPPKEEPTPTVKTPSAEVVVPKKPAASKKTAEPKTPAARTHKKSEE